MPLNLQNIEDAKRKLAACNIDDFSNTDNSFVHFINGINIKAFRHINDLTMSFVHPVTILSGGNTTGKTSLLLILACSHEDFKKVDATSPTPSLRKHSWTDVVSFTSHETVSNDYSYQLSWRIGKKKLQGEGKRLATSKAWSGLAKKSADIKRVNAKIRGREVRLIDMERTLPGRSFSDALFRKANGADSIRLIAEIEQAFAYILDLPEVEIRLAGGHINKSCYLIKRLGGVEYSTYNAATGEESLISMLREIIESPDNSLILIDEIEAGFHPRIQRKLADIIQYLSWVKKKQFIITTHSPTMLEAFPQSSRRFVERTSGGYKVIGAISPQAARSKMDVIGHPLVQLYCEDDLAEFLIKKALVVLSKDDGFFERNFSIIKSGPICNVKLDYIRHKRNYSQFAYKLGYCAIFDGDYAHDLNYSFLSASKDDFAHFIYPYEAPEKFLVREYLQHNPSNELQVYLQQNNNHGLFKEMCKLGLAADESDARGLCYQAFQSNLTNGLFSVSRPFELHIEGIKRFLLEVYNHFSTLP